MDRRDGEPDAGDSLKPGELSAEDELWRTFGRVIGFTVAAIILVVGGGILVIALAGLFFNFVYGH